MNVNVNTTGTVLAEPVLSQLICRLEEIESVLAVLDAAWDSKEITSSQRRCTVRHTKRGLIDAICDLDNLKGSPA